MNARDQGMSSALHVVSALALALAIKDRPNVRQDLTAVLDAFAELDADDLREGKIDQADLDDAITAYAKTIQRVRELCDTILLRITED